MPEQTLNVYVSSTWFDLRQERAAVLTATTRLRGLSFLGMEFFGSRHDSTLHTSLGELDRADVYVCIVGERYGSGITEREYERAHERELPIFIYLKTSPDAGGATSDRAPDPRLEAFRQRLRRAHTCSEYASADDLAVRLAADLHNWMFERHLARGLAALSTEYLSRVQAFLAEYVGGRDRHVPFGGRADELAALDRWLDQPQSPPFLFLGAGAGKGKSALLVRWMRDLLERDEVAAVFYPVSIRFRTNLASVVFPCLATSLAALHQEALKTTPDTPPEVWRGLVTDLLARPLRSGRTLVVVVDGLDEAADWSAGPDLFPPLVGRHARVVVAARFLAGDVDGSDWCRRLGWDGSGVATTMTLSALRLPGVAEVLDRMGFPLSVLGERHDIVHELHRLSQGEPLIIRLYVDDLWSRGESSTRLRVEDLRAIEPGLDGYFARWWDDQRRLWGSARPMQERRVQALMNVLACALGPLNRDDLLSVLEPLVEINSWTLEEALEPLQRFIVGDGVDNGYVYSHPGLAIYFRERLSRRERDDIDQRIVDWCAASVADVAAGRRSPGELASYVLQHFGAHLERQNSPVEAFAPLLTDGWRRAWHARDGSYAAYRADLRRVRTAAAQRAPTTTGATAQALALEMRAALCMASVDQLSDNTPPELVAALVQKDVWNPAAGAGYARLIRDPVRRAKALISLAPIVAESARTQVLREALAAVEVAPDTAQVRLLNALAPSLPRALVGDAVAIALAIDNRALMADALVCLAPRLTPWLIERVVTAVCSLSDDAVRQRLLLALACAHPSIFDAWARNGDDREPWERAWTLLGVHDGLDDPTGSPALTAAAELAERVDSEVARLDLFAAVAERAQPADRAPHIGRVLRELATIRHAPLLASILGRLTSLVSGDQASDLRAAALEACAGIRSDGARADALARLAPELDEAAAGRALRLAEAIEDDASRGQAIAALVPRLAIGTRPRAVEQVLAIPDTLERLAALSCIADFLPQATVAAALADAESEELSPRWRFQIMRKLAPRAGNTLAALGAGHLYGELELAEFAAIARFCPAPLRAEVDRRVLGSVAALPPGGDVEEALDFLCEWAADAAVSALTRATDAVLNWNTARRIQAIERLAPCLPAPTLEQAFRRLQRLGDESARLETQMQCLSMLGPAVVEGRLGAFWMRSGASDRVLQTLRWWSAGLGDSAILRADVVALLPNVDSGPRRAEAVAEFMRLAAGTVTTGELTVLLDAAIALPDPVVRASTLSWLVPHLQHGQRERFRDLLAAALYDSDEAGAVAAAVAARMEPDEFLDAFVGLWSDAVQRNAWDPDHAPRLLAIARVARAVPNPLRDAATDRLFASFEGLDRGQLSGILNLFGRRLEVDHEFFAECFRRTRALDGPERVQSALALAPRLDPTTVCEALAELLDQLEQLPPVDRARALSEALDPTAAQVVGRGAWRAGLVLAFVWSLPEHASRGLIARAAADLGEQPPHDCTTSAAIGLLRKATPDLRDRLVGTALAGLPHLPGALQSDALHELDAVVDGRAWDRRESPVFALAPYVDRPHLDRCETLFAAEAANSDAATFVAGLALRLTAEGFLECVDRLCSRALSRIDNPYEAAAAVARVARLAAGRDESTRRESGRRMASAVGNLDGWRRQVVLEATGALECGVLADPEHWRVLVGTLDPAACFIACVPLLKRVRPVDARAAILQLIRWGEDAPASVRRRAVSAEGAGLPSSLASAGAWRAALVALWLSAGAEDEVGELEGLADLAVADTEANAAVAPLTEPMASEPASERLVRLALLHVRRLERPDQAAALMAIGRYAPSPSHDVLVDAVTELLRGLDDARPTDGAGTLVRTQLREAGGVMMTWRTHDAVGTLVRELLPRVGPGHARALWREAMRAGVTAPGIADVVDRLSDETVAALAGDVLAGLSCATAPEGSWQLRRWIARQPLDALERLPVDLRPIARPSFVAVALAHAVARVPAARRETLRSAAIVALRSADPIDWHTLIAVRDAAGTDEWPELSACFADAIRRHTAPRAQAEMAAIAIPLLDGPARHEVVATVIETLAALPPEGVEIRASLRRLPTNELVQLLHRVCEAWERPAERDALLLPLTSASQKALLVDRITTTNLWLSDARLFETVFATAADGSIAALLADRAVDYPTADADVRERMLALWGRVPVESPAWHALSAHLMFAAAAESRANVMRTLQKMLPGIFTSLGPAPIADAVESMEAVSEWWP